MPGWKFSFITAIGIGLITGTGIEPEVTMGHGVISEEPECPMHCEIYRLIFVAMFAITNEFAIGTSRRIGRRGSETSTGTNAMIDTRYEMSAMIGDGKAATVNAEGKENTSAKTTALAPIFLPPRP
jgi:hypothetical protein